MPIRPLAALLALLLALALPACAGQSREDFIADADEICEDAAGELAQLGEPESPDDVAEYAEEARDVMGETYDRLTDLAPPDELEGDFEAYLENSNLWADHLELLGDAGESGDEAELQRVLGSPVAENLGRESARLADSIGFESCGRDNAPGQG